MGAGDLVRIRAGSVAAAAAADGEKAAAAAAAAAATAAAAQKPVQDADVEMMDTTASTIDANDLNVDVMETDEDGNLSNDMEVRWKIDSSRMSSRQAGGLMRMMDPSKPQQVRARLDEKHFLGSGKDSLCAEHPATPSSSSTTAPSSCSTTPMSGVCGSSLAKSDLSKAASAACGNSALGYSCGEPFAAPRQAPAAAPTAAKRPSHAVDCSEDSRHTNLAHFYVAAENRLGMTAEDSCCAASGRICPSPLPIGAFVQVRRLAKSIHGDVYAYRWRRDCQDDGLRPRASTWPLQESSDPSSDYVAVKQLPSERLDINKGKETNELKVHLDSRNAPSCEDALTEIGVLSYLTAQADCPAYLPRMLGIFTETRQTWLVTEFCEGGELFSLVERAGREGRELPEAEVRRYMWQLLQAVAYLHKHHIGHRDISLENVLLRKESIKLIDFGMAVTTHSAAGTPYRYYRVVGKDFYRAPECYVPIGSSIKVVAPAGVAPGDVMLVPCGASLCEVKLPLGAKVGQICSAELWGYAAQPADVFSTGICLFILAWRSPPWHRALLTDPSFSFARGRGDAGIETLLKNWQRKPLQAEVMTLLAEMLRPDPSKRPTAAACLESPWFASFSDLPIPARSTPMEDTDNEMVADDV
eukprot:TRINITY_DN112152_c0_g1_i1.p1 TRINITY_DN112152_c0_g1~~TRINITY_DN112152_c0_g1_i1.p1  ORF type:complete len:641 (+),score=106.73 TRINITY_DN112152_c0_g1_i1:70-1992(+)